MAAAVHVLVFDGFADWGSALALSELRRRADVAVVSVGFDDWPVTSDAGLRVLPDRELWELASDDVRLLLLPGGAGWEEERYPRAELDALLAHLADDGVPIAAIGEATLALARAGLLAGRAHTAEMREFLTWHVPGYAGVGRWVDAPVVHDGGIITAPASAPSAFARAVVDAVGEGRAVMSA